MELDPNCWYALRVSTRCEKQVSELLKLKGCEIFLPTSPSRKRWSDRLRVVEAPLFPGYLFCRLGRDTIGRILTTPGVVHFVGFGRTPAPVDETELSAVKRIVASTNDAQSRPHLKAGERVEICSGPLAGLRGLVLDSDSARLFVVGVTLLQRSLAVKVCPSWVIASTMHRRAIAPAHPKGFRLSSRPDAASA